jgi:signal transduction histidine kinase
MQQHIWDRFYQVKGITVQSGSGGGHGLGLHICRTLIQRHDGTVGVEKRSWERLHLLVYPARGANTA